MKQSTYKFFLRNNHSSPWVLVEENVPTYRFKRLKECFGKDAMFEKE